MIFEAIFAPLFLLIDFIITLIPSVATSGGSGFDATYLNFVAYGLYFFGTVPFFLIVGNFLFWVQIEFAWSIIEWLYRKIPGVS